MRRNMLVFLLVAVLGTGYGLAQSSETPPKKKSESRAAKAAEVKRGKAIYNENCGICHYGANRAKKIGPGLKGIYKRGKFADGKKVNDEAMREWIVRGGVDMPSFEDALNKQQIDDLIAYLKTL